MRLSHAEMATRLAAMARMKNIWLQEHGPKRSEMDRALRLRELEALEQAAQDYETAAKRNAA